MKKILVVDDNIVMFRLFQIQVQRSGHEGFFFQDGTTALEQFENIKPDLAVLDYHLPDIDGIELYKKIKELPGGKDIKVIFVTGSADQDKIDEIKKVGVKAYLSKPFSPKKLQTMMNDLLAEK